MKAKFYYIIILFLFSCTRNHITSCQITMDDIAGKYKITKLESVAYSTGDAQDITSTLTTCERAGIYTFNTDSSAAYIEPNNCTGSGTGKWYTSNMWFYISLTPSDASRIGSTLIEKWDCSNLVLITRYPSVNFNNRYTLTKQ